jgi:hypothetical protein
LIHSDLKDLLQGRNNLAVDSASVVKSTSVVD